MRWHYRDPALVWLFVPAYLVHVAEEWFAEFPAWLRLIVGEPLPATAYVVINVTALVLLIAGIRAAVRSEEHGWMVVAAATVMLVNTIAHALGTIVTRTYSPGLISAVVLYVPLGALTMIRAGDRAEAGVMSRGVFAGLLIHAGVFAVAATAARM